MHMQPQNQRQRKYVESRVEEIVVEIVSPVSQISLLVDYEVTPPFCAFEVTSNTPEYTKSGISGWKSDVTIYYVHSDEQTATANKREILKALASYTSDRTGINIDNVTETFDDGYFAWKIDIQVIEKI